MRPPVCAICDRDIRDIRDIRDESELEFDLVQCADFEPIEGPGHPNGLEWFCADHIEPARKLKNLKRRDAVNRIKAYEV